MRYLKLIILLVIAGAFIWGCVEDVAPGRNRSPNVWFTRGPDNNSVTFLNSVDFEWMATDFDDDLGMGATYVRLEPSTVEWTDTRTGSLITFTHPDGWVRVYENSYEVLDLPDTSFYFSVQVVDGRGADSTVTRRFIVRFDNIPPIVHSRDCPPAKPDNPVFPWTFVIEAHDSARSERAKTPKDSLEYTYRYVGPAGVRTVEPVPLWSTANNVFEVLVDGQTYPGDYTFWYQVRDRALNTTELDNCRFTIEP